MIVDLPPTGVVLRPNFGHQSAIADRDCSPCRHGQYQLDGQARTVSCGTCGHMLDAFQVLLDYARSERRWRHWDGEASRTRAALAELQAEERKVKARTAAASRKDALVAVEDERRKGALRQLEIARKAREIARLSAQVLRLSGAGH